MQDQFEQLSPTKRAILELRELRARLEEQERRRAEPIAIVGIGCRFPGGAIDPDTFWRLLSDGVDAISEVPPDRWDIDAYYDADPDAPGKMSTRWGGFLENVDQFDPDFFGISTREAATLDPQQRLLLEVTWEALERAGYAPERLFGSSTGVFVGIGSFDYMQLQLQRQDASLIDAYLATGGCHSVASGRLSYVLGLQGPSVSVDTACSSSLVGVHMACQSLRVRECNLAVAGGVNVILAPELLINFSKSHMMAPDGRCKVFDAAADGFVRAEGCGVVVLQRLSDALAQRANILAVVRGSAINQDGRSSGLTAPNGPSQQAVIGAALASAGVQPADIDYVEAHGTGTSLGDPIEVHALGAALGEGRSAATPLRLGSVKTNIGHAEAAAGIAGLIKVVLSLQHGEIPAHLNLRTLSPHIDWSRMPVVVPTARSAWPRGGRPRLAGVSSFGFSGTNAHVILEESPGSSAAPAERDRPMHVMTVSARHPESLRELAAQYADRLEGQPDAALADIAYTANAGRTHFAHRAVIKAARVVDAQEQLRAVAEQREQPAVPVGVVDTARREDVVFLFAGQGSQYPQMGRQLYESEPTFRRAIDQCDELLRPHVDRSIRETIYPEPGAATPLDQTVYTQPALFALEYALAQLWRSWGVEPAAVIGHSLGEDVAACVAGVFSLEEGLELIATRGRLMQALPQDGEMYAVFAEDARVAAAIARFASDVTVAAVNGPSQVTISGRRDRVRQVVAALQEDGVKTRPITASHAFHSPLMDPMLDEYERLASGVRYGEPTTAFVSNVTGGFVEPGEITSARYWRRHVRDTVRFAEGIQALYDRGYRLFVEIGPNSTLASMGRNALGATDALWLPSIKQGRDWDQILETLGALYLRGARVDWEGFDGAFGRRRVALPTSPFRRRRFWFEESGSASRSKVVVDAASRWAALVSAGRQHSDLVPIDLGLPTYAAKWDVLDRLSTAYIVSVFHEIGVFSTAGETLTVADIMARGGVLETYHHLLGRWCRKLASQGLLRETGHSFVAAAPLAEPPIQALTIEARETLADAPFLIEYLERCGRLMGAVLTGRESALETLFPGGSFDTAERIYHHWAYSRYFGGIGRAVIDAAARGLPDRPVRVIEVGAGTGGLTTSLLGALPPERTTYCYTDVSEFFFAEARRRFAAYPFVRYSVLDLEQAPQSQGYGAHAFDIVVAANVLHATRRLDETLLHVRSLLAPGGILVLYEVTDPPAWFDVSIALIEGWQRFDDGLRGDGPLLTREQWQRALQAAAFDACEAFPYAGSPAEILGAHILVGRAPASGAAREVAADVLAAIAAPPQPDTRVPEPSPGRSDEIVAALAHLPALERQERLVGHVRDHVMHVLRREASESIGRRDRLMDLGIDSLMAVELRDRLTSGFALPRRLPATLIFDCPTVDAIATLIATLLPIPADAGPAEAVAAASTATSRDKSADVSDEQIADLLLRKLESL